MSASQPATGGDNSQGVKPSNSTKHDTYAKASSDQTKQYGNGKTAGEIATQAGHGSDTLHGPGNSQPHKTAACPGGHEVDVHALKHGSDRCASGEQPVQRQKPASKPEPKRVDVKKSEQADVVVQKSKSHGVAESAQLHVTICHATGSSSNPYVRISPSAFGVFHGHLGHQDGRDIVPPFTWNGHTYSENWDANGQALFNAGCSAPARAEAQGVHGAEATQECGTGTKAVTERVFVGVKHMIGPKGSGRFVLIHPSEHSAHLTGKHEDDVPVYETATRTIMVPSEGCPAASSLSPSPYVPAPVASSSTSAPGVASESASASAQAAGTAPAIAAGPATAAASRPAPAGSGAAPAAVGGVKGAVVALHPTKEKPSGGVLGATTRLGGTVASTRLPFTGLPLWIFALAALALVAVGYTLRRSSAGGT